MYLDISLHFVDIFISVWNVFYGHVFYLVFEVGMNLLACMDIFYYVMAVIFIVSIWYICGWLCIVFVLSLIQSSTLEVGGISGWKEVTIYAYMFIFSVSLVCMDGWHICLLSHHIYAFVMHLDLHIIFFYMHMLRGSFA